MNLEDIYSQIDKEADDIALVWPWGYSQADAENLAKPQPAMQINAVRRQFYIKGATSYAEKWYEVEQLKVRYEKALKEIRKWELATGAKIKVKHIDILKDIMKTVNEALTHKTSTDDTIDG